MNRTSTILDASGRPFVHSNGKNRNALARVVGRPTTANATYDLVRDTEEMRRHWANADALDPDTANSAAVRHKGMQRSRYENGANGYYCGIIRTHCNMVVGVGPTLRMLTKNRDFNQQIEREFYAWALRVQLRRKLWCMCHARIQDGEAFALLQTNPGIPSDQVQLDLKLIEAEQCQTPLLKPLTLGYIDGIKFDEHNNIQWYDILPFHPGSARLFFSSIQPIRISPSQMLHWYKMERPGDHRSMPAMTSTVSLGANSRRVREATVRKAEIEADYSVLLESTLAPDDAENLVDPMTSFDIEKGMMTVLPDGVKPSALSSNTPSANYNDFTRSHVAETARPLSQASNVAAMDSANSSFASGKLDYLSGRTEINVERADCNDLVLDPLFKEWFAERSLVGLINDVAPVHQWDWPAHPVIDADSETKATDRQLHNGTTTLRDVYTEQSQDFEDQLIVMTEDTFGEATPANIKKMRTIIALKNTPEHAMRYVAEVLGVQLPQPAGAPNNASAQPGQASGNGQINGNKGPVNRLNGAR